MKNGDRSAYPVPLNPGEIYSGHDTPDGLTKRELFAMAAMQGFNANPATDLLKWDERDTAEASIRFADALLAELSKEPQS